MEDFGPGSFLPRSARKIKTLALANTYKCVRFVGHGILNRAKEIRVRWFFFVERSFFFLNKLFICFFFFFFF